MSNKQNVKNQVDHTVPSPKRNQTQNYYSQLLGRTNSHFYPGFLSPQLNAINQNQIQYNQNPMLNSLQIASSNQPQLFQSQQQQSLASSQHTVQNNGQNINNPNTIDNSKNNFKLTDILSTRYSSGALKLMRNGQTSTSSNPRQLSNDTRQFDIASSYNSNNLQNKEAFYTPTNNQKSQGSQQQQVVNFQNSSNLQQNQATLQQNNHHNIKNTQQVHKSQLINSSKCQTSSNQKQQQNSHNNHTLQNNHNIHNSGYYPNNNQQNSNSGNQQNLQSSTISPRTISNIVQDKLARSKLQAQTKNQQQAGQQTQGQGSVKEQVKNQQTSTKRPKSLKQIDNDHFSINNSHQVIHEQNMNILANMTLNHRNGSEKNLIKSQQFGIQNLMAQSVSSHPQQQQLQQHTQQLHSSKVMLIQQQNSLHSTETIHNLMSSSKGSNFNTTGPIPQVNQKYELNQSKHQTSHSLEKFRGQSESLDLHQQKKQQESLAYQVQKVIMNKQQQQYQKKTNGISDAKSRSKKPQDHHGQQRNPRNGYNKKQQPIIQQNLSQSQQHNIHLSPQLTSINNQSSNINSHLLAQNNNQASQNYYSNPVQSHASPNNNLNSKQTLSAITQRIQQNLNTLNDPISSVKNGGQSTYQTPIQSDHQNNEAVEGMQYNIRQDSHENIRDNSSNRIYQQGQIMDSQLISQNIQKSKSSLYESNKIKSSQQQIQTEENVPSNLILSQVQPQTIQMLIQQNLNSYNSVQGQINHESSHSNTPSGKPMNTHYSKQNANTQNKDNKHQIYFMKEKERGFKKYEQPGSKIKRKGEQSQPHSNSQGVPLILMSNSVTCSTQNQFGSIYVLQKSQGQIPNSSNSNINHFVNQNIMKSLSKDNLKSEEDRIMESQSIDQLSNSQYQSLTNSQKQGQFDDPKQLQGQIVNINENIQTGNHGKRNSLPEGNLIKKQFVNTESSYLGDLRNSDLYPFMSPQSLSTYHPEDVGGHLNEIQCQNSQIKNISNPPTQKNNHLNFIQTQQQILQLGNSIQQAKAVNAELGSATQTSDQTKYLQSLFNNFFQKDSKSKLNEKVNNTEPQENTFLNGSTINIYRNEDNINISSHSATHDSQKQYIDKQSPQTQNVSSDQKLEDIQIGKPQYNLKNQFRQEKDKSNANFAHTEANPMNIQIRFKQQSCSNQNSVNDQFNQSPSITQSKSQYNSVNTSPISQFKSQVLNTGDQSINKLKNEIQKDFKLNDENSSNNKIEYSSLNSSQIDIKNRQSVHTFSDNNLKEPSNNRSIISVNQNDNSQNQNALNISNMSLNKELIGIKQLTQKILINYKICQNELENSIKEKNIQISEFNQILEQKDGQFNSIQAQNEQFRKQIETYKSQIDEKDNLIAYLQSQIQINKSKNGNKVFNQQQNNLIQNNNPFVFSISQKNSQNNSLNKIQTNSQYNSQTSSQNNSQYNQNIMIQNYTLSPRVNRSISNINTSFNGNSPAQQMNDYENECAGDQKQSNNQFVVNKQQDMRYSLPAFSKEHFRHSQETSDRNQDNSQSSPSNQEQHSADFTGNKEDVSLDTLKKKYQINSVNKKQKSKITQSQQFTKSGDKNWQMFASASSYSKSNNKKSSYTYSENNDREKDPLNDSTKLLKQISKQSAKIHSQEQSDNSQNLFSSRKQSYSNEFVKTFQNNQQNQQQNIFTQNQSNDNQNIQYFGYQGSFNNLQALEKLNTDNSNNDDINQNVESVHNKQNQQNNLFSYDKEKYNSQGNDPIQPNQLNTSGNFSNGNACFGCTADDENDQNNENSFGEQNFGRQSSKHQDDSSKQQNFSPFQDIISSQIQSMNVQQEMVNTNQKISSNDVSFRSKSSTQNKQIYGGNHSPSLNGSFSNKQTPIQIAENNNSFQQNKLNDSFNVDHQIKNEEHFTVQFNENNETEINQQNEGQQNQVNISFEGFEQQQQQQNDMKSHQNNNNEDNIQENENLKINALLEEQQQNISFTNQSFG